MNSFFNCSTAVFCLLLINSTLGASELALAKGAVVSSIKPVHSLVEGVLGEVGTSVLLVDGSASMHNYQLKPSQQRALSVAKIVFYIDANAETFLERAFEASESSGKLIALADNPVIPLLEKRLGDDWQQHSHGEEDDHQINDEEHHLEHGSNVDLHIWLNPNNALLMVQNIKQVLESAFPEHTAAFNANAQVLSQKLRQLDSMLEQTLLSVKDQPFIVFHDAFGYFEQRYALNGVGSILIDTRLSPSVSQVQSVRRTIESTSAACVFSEPQFSNKIISIVVEGKDINSARVDPLGANIDAGPTLYFELMRALGRGFEKCLGT